MEARQLELTPTDISPVLRNILKAERRRRTGGVLWLDLYIALVEEPEESVELEVTVAMPMVVLFILRMAVKQTLNIAQ